MSDAKAVSEFLAGLSMHPLCIDLERESDEFCAQMKLGLEKNNGSSLMMIPTFVGADGRLPKNEKVIVIDAGGTNFRVGVIHFDDGGALVKDYFEKYRMPGCDKEITMNEFYETAADRLMPIIDESDKIGFCFSYAVDMQKDRDGKVVKLSKEVRISDSEGKPVCDGIKKALRARGVEKEKTFIMLNDTVATMLGGKAVFSDVEFESYLGFILGTGTNLCYMENSANIKKSADAMSVGGYMAVNIESGNFDAMPRGEVDVEFDRGTKMPGMYKLEKMLSGGYIGKVMFATAKRGARDGLFSKTFAQRIEALDDFSLRDVDDYCFDAFCGNALSKLVEGCDEDRVRLYLLIDALYERSAKICAASFAGILKHTGMGLDPTRPVCLCADGTVFYKSKCYRKHLDYYVMGYIVKTLGRYLEFIRCEEATLVGTGVAALLN